MEPLVFSGNLQMRETPIYKKSLLMGRALTGDSYWCILGEIPHKTSMSDALYST